MKALTSIAKLSHRKFIALAMAAGITASGTLVWSASNAAFTGQTTNPTNSWTTGSVSIEDDDDGATHNPATGTAMFTAAENAALLPGAGGYQCIKVTYKGTVAADVKLFASAHSAGLLDGQVHLTVEINDQTTGATDTGTFSTNAAGCNDNATNGVFHTDGDGPIFSGTLATFWAANQVGGGGGVTDVGATWHPTAANQFRVFRFHWWLDAAVDGANHQGETCTMDFQWTTTT